MRIHLSLAALATLTLPFGLLAQEKTPDISGLWSARGLSANIYEKGDPYMTPWAKQKLAEAKPSFGPKSVLLTETNDPVYKCYPPGVPRIYFHPFPLQIVQIPGQVILLYEYDHTVRHVFTDGRKHPEDAEPTWLGHSIGHWEGDTLVIDTTNFTDQNPFPGAQNLHVVERLTRADDDTIRYQFTVEDPGMWTKPWSGELPITRIQGQIYEYACHEANYALADILRGARVAEAEAAKKAERVGK
jgi:hypothetical protein